MSQGTKGKKKMSDEERTKLVQKLQDDLESFVAEKSREARKKRESNPEPEKSFEEQLEELVNHPAFIKEVDLTKPLRPEVEGLIQLKYETDDPTARADSYREDGNENFKKKDYRLAISNYTEAIKSNCPNKELNAICYSNRAAAQFHLQNYRSSFNDCIFARKFKPDHFKAVIKGAQCCMEMKKYADTVKWCDAALIIEPQNEKMLEIRNKADKLKRAEERDVRKREAQERKEEAAEKKLLDIIQGRGIKISGLNKSSDTSKLNPLLLSSLESHSPTGAKVCVDESGTLYWPVLLFYPEHAETDFIEAFDETNRFSNHLVHMFGPDVEHPSWDEEHKYIPERLEIYFENREEEKLYEVDKNSTLLNALKHKKFFVSAGTPCFILLVTGSKFKEDYLKKYKMT